MNEYPSLEDCVRVCMCIHAYVTFYFVIVLCVAACVRACASVYLCVSQCLEQQRIIDFGLCVAALHWFR